MARMTLNETAGSISEADRQKLATTSEDDIRRYKTEDGIDPDVDLFEDAKAVLPPGMVRDIVSG